MRHLDLFSGIGGFALAASWTWPDHEIAVFCDIDPFAHKVLNKHWPNVPIINDVRKINRETVHGTIDLVTGGFPCQPFSQAGKRKGTDDDRYLWPEMHRIIAEFRPRWVLGENVSGLFTIEDGMAFERVCSDLAASGYEVWPLRIPACATGAPHRRDRWWFVAHARHNTTKSNRTGDRVSQEQQAIIHADNERRQGKAILDRGCSDILHTSADAYGAIATNAEHNRRNGTQLPIQSGKQERQGAMLTGSDSIVANPTGPRLERGAGQSVQRRSTRSAVNDWDRPWLEVAAAFCRVDDGIPGQLDRDRKHRLKALGNAIVPQVAYQIMKAMKHADET